ncbi:type II toxin-antitoxin system RelE/ParE family toxin [Candidatus Daviesbacteria bacterium]|nr:type II toxin-antitoxin system RelE/ParE family toxin [Candidatus Daviesbacteria bacterium]
MDEGWQINYYISSSGDSPVKNFLDERPVVKSKAFRIFQYIKEYGLTVAIPHIKKLAGTPIWEIRILGGDSVRIFYITRQEKKILLLHAFVKKTDKTPPKEIAIALSRIPPIDK